METIRTANIADLTAIVALLAQDPLGSKRENNTEPLPTPYVLAFERIQADPQQELVVMTDKQGTVIGTMQLSFIQYLTYQGGVRAQVEGVRIRNDQRGKGLGEVLIQWAIKRAEERGAHVLQLTTDKLRPEALRFYEKLGFIASHEGMKRHLENIANGV